MLTETPALSNGELLIKLDNVGKQYRSKVAIDSVSLSIYTGQIITLIGPNGAGKTTLARIVLGLEKPSSGVIFRKNALKIGYMPQKLHIDLTLPLTVLRFLQLAEPDKIRCAHALQQVGIEHLSNSPLQSVSGGEMQRALLARAILCKPDLLVLDEPVQGVDVIGQEALYHLIAKLRDSLGCAVLMVSHDLHLVMSATDEVVCLNQHICCHGSPEQVTTSPAFLEIFGAKTAFYQHDHDHKHDLRGNVVCQHNEKGRGDDNDPHGEQN
ncbi:MAG: zinc ABC transporter ATP-binding protein ZnuC [Pseudomonadales bacterium]|nr:zinc ABC transporter ATP-binding protein ZnuC [Pseudomonadales bacterium]MCP5172983.1 zinc ABC transporter ATP-binding protein ZnuC [Pseudomonadales bacterium]MCP5302456.1 zinc ABC transporter ATP-binding protein ZnuC [Pseudomonadales bacterium]